MKDVIIWQLVGARWEIERTYCLNYARFVLSEISGLTNIKEGQIIVSNSGRKFAYFADGIDPNKQNKI